MLLSAKQLTSGERFLVDRRRRGEPIVDAAKRLGLSVYGYQALEAGAELGGAQEPRLGALQPYEAAFLLRRRAGLTVADLATQVGVSRWWITQMERGMAPADRLVAHWRAQGGKSRRRGGLRKR